MSDARQVDVVVVAYGPSSTLERCVTALLASTGVEPTVLVVDNDADPVVLGRVAQLDPGRVAVIGPGRNRGFAEGCNVGAAAGTGDVIALINPDAYVEPEALAALCAVLDEDDVGVATASVRLAADPELLNSAGNPVHYSCLAWSGAFREPASEYAAPCSVTSASGAACALERELWKTLGGFDGEYFAYLEDTELSLRARLAGYDVRYVPGAVVLHDYEFSRNPTKLFLLERNRQLLIWTTFQWRTLLVLAPGLLLFELAMLAQSLVGRSFGAKLRSYWWLLTNLGHVARRRREVQRGRTRSDRDALLPWLSGRVTPANVATPPGMDALNALLGGYWRLTSAVMRVRRPAAGPQHARATVPE